MEVKQKECCIVDCESSTLREDDRGVTFHKFPKDKELRAQWCYATRRCRDLTNRQYVCSRHFYKADFETFRDSKYLLRAGAIPSIFSWTLHSITEQMDTEKADTPVTNEQTDLQENTATDGDNDNNSVESKVNDVEPPERTLDDTTADTTESEIKNEKQDEINIQDASDSLSLDGNTITVMRTIHSYPLESDDDSLGTNTENITVNIMTDTNIINSDRKSPSVSPKKIECDSTEKEDGDSVFSEGSLVEVMDFEGVWYTALITEVDDSEDMEVLVHYDNEQKHDEWISVSSSRIRTLIKRAAQSPPRLPKKIFSTPSVTNKISSRTKATPIRAPSAQIGSNIKIPLQYKVGERCYARWSDNRRFPATVRSVLENGKYEIIFDDGICRVCQWYCLSRMKTKKATSSASGSNTIAFLSPPTVRQSKSLPPVPAPSPAVPFHRHLFDPKLDYLGPKSERREMKKKLDVKTLFNIGRRNSVKPTKRKKLPILEEAPPAKKKKGKGQNYNFLDAKEETGEERVLSPKLEVKDEIKYEDKEEVKQNNEIKESVILVPVALSVQTPKLNPEKLREKPLPHSDNATSEVKEVRVRESSELSVANEITSNNEHTITEGQDNKNDINTNIAKPVKSNVAIVLTPMKMKRRKSSNKKSKKDVVGPEGLVTEKLEEETIATGDTSITDPIQIDTSNSFSIRGSYVGTVDENISSVDVDSVGAATTCEVAQENASKEEITFIPAPTTDPSLTDANYSANIPLEDMQGSYTMDIDEGLKLIAEAVESFEADQALKAENKMDVSVPGLAKTDAQMAEQYEATLNEGEWCCRWVDGEPQGVVYEFEVESPVKTDGIVLPRKSILVEDKRLPPDWTKILVRRCYGNSAGKWDVVLIDPFNRRLRDKGEMRIYLSGSGNENLKSYEDILMDFSVHRKLARRMGWDSTTTNGTQQVPIVMSSVAPVKVSHSPRIKIKPLKRLNPLKLKKKGVTHIRPTLGAPGPKKKKRPLPVPQAMVPMPAQNIAAPTAFTPEPVVPMYCGLPLVDGSVFVGSMKVQIIENLFRCPAEGCFKNFRKDDLLRMHIKHYHRELRKFLGSTPKVSDLAVARTAIPEDTIVPKLRCEGDNKVPKVKSTPKGEKGVTSGTEAYLDTAPSTPTSSLKNESTDKMPSLQDSPKLRIALENQQPTKRPKVLYPVKKEIKSEQASPRSGTPSTSTDIKPKEDMEAIVKLLKLPDMLQPKMKIQPEIEHLDFEAAISTHTVTKPTYWKRKQKSSKKPKAENAEPSKKKSKCVVPKWAEPIEADQWDISDLETRSSYGTPESKTVEKKPDVPSQLTTPYAAEAPDQEPGFLISDTGEKIKIEHMKREEIINCHCGFAEEDGLMIQCDLCLCWQHAICHGYDTNTVPDKYTCSICLNPRRGRSSRRFLHDQCWLYEGELPGGAPDAALRRAHELTGNLLKLSHALRTLRLKYHVATSKKDHPKLYLWAKDWETSDTVSPEKVVTEQLHHVDLNDVFCEIGKENLPLKQGTEEASDSQKDDGQPGSQGLLANLLSSPGGPSLELPISTSELESLAKSVQESEMNAARGRAPEPEVAIESGACRKNLMRHIQRLQALIDARLDSIEAQVAELESQDPWFEDDETAEYFPRTKQTIQMLHRDLDTLHELGVIT